MAILLVPVGDCASCIAADLPRWEQECRRAGVACVLITAATHRAARSFTQELHLRSHVICEPQARLLRWLNAPWAGRAYLLDSQCRLLWLQKTPGGSGYSPLGERDVQKALREARR